MYIVIVRQELSNYFIWITEMKIATNYLPFGHLAFFEVMLPPTSTESPEPEFCPGSLPPLEYFLLRCSFFYLRCSFYYLRCSFYYLRRSIYCLRCSFFYLRCSLFLLAISYTNLRCEYINLCWNFIFCFTFF